MTLLFTAIQEYLDDNHPEWVATCIPNHEYLIDIKQSQQTIKFHLLQINMKNQVIMIIPGTIYTVGITEDNLLSQITLHINMIDQK